MDDVSAVCGSKMVPFKKREKQTELTYNFCRKECSPRCLVHSFMCIVLARSSGRGWGRWRV